MISDSIGKNIRKCRLAKKMKRDVLAERTNLSVTYIGMLERGEKTPSLESFVKIVNALETSADVVLAEVLADKYEIKFSLLNGKLAWLSEKDKNLILDVIEIIIEHKLPLNRPQYIS